MGCLQVILEKIRLNSSHFRKGLFYVFLSFFNKSLSVSLLPVLTYTLSTEDFGNLTIFSNILIVLQAIIYFGVVQSFSSDYFKEGKALLGKAFLSYLAVPFSIAAIVSLAILLIGDSLVEELKFSYQIVLLIPLISLSNLMYELLLALLRNEKKEKAFAAVTISRTVLEIGLVLVLVVWLRENWQGRVYSILIAYAAIGLFSIFIFRRINFLSGRIKGQILRKDLTFGFSVIVTQFSFLAISSFDKFCINYFHGKSETGVYGLAFTIATINTMVSGALMQYYIPAVYECLASGNKNNQLRQIFMKYMGLMFGISVLQAIFIPIFYYLFIGREFHSGVKYSMIITLSSFFWALSYFCFQILYYFKYKRKLLATSMILLATGLITNYIFIKELALTGAAVGACTIHLIVLFTLLTFTWKDVFGTKSNQVYELLSRRSN